MLLAVLRIELYCACMGKFRGTCKVFEHSKVVGEAGWYVGEAEPITPEELEQLKRCHQEQATKAAALSLVRMP
jgi:hypothetical protein